MAARITDVCGGVLDFLAGIMQPAAPDTVGTAYAAYDVLELMDGKRVRVFPAAYGDAERLARRRVMKEFKIAVVVEVPYLAAASPSADGAVPPAWVDDQVAYVEANVFDPLNTAFVHQADGLLLGSLTCWTCAVVVVYDPLRLAEEKVFVSIVEVAYRESTRGLAMAKLGIDASAYLNTATLPAGWTTPTWAELDGISDLTENTKWDVAPIIIRRSLVKQGAKSVVDIGVTCKILREPLNTLYVTILTAIRSRTPVDVMFLDASVNTVGAEGFRYMAQVVDGGGSQNTGDALFRDLVFVPFPDGDATHIPEWANVQVTAGTVVFTAIQPPTP